MTCTENAIPGLESTRWYDRARQLAFVPNCDVTAAIQRSWTIVEHRLGYAIMTPAS